MPRSTTALTAVAVGAAVALGTMTAAPTTAEASTITASARVLSNNQVAYNYFVTKGLTRQQSAAVVGNFMQESGSPINPKARQNGGPGMGIAQWSRGSRWSQLVRYASKTKRSPYALRTQLDFVWVELNGSEKRALKTLRATKTTAAATMSFSAHYERCAPRYCANGTRIRNANKVFKLYA